MYRVSAFIRHFAWSLLIGAALATVWVNLSPASYYDAMEWRLLDLRLPHWISDSGLRLTLMQIAIDILMPLFFFALGKELWEAHVLERGSLRGSRGGVPFMATLGRPFGGGGGLADPVCTV